jgi:histidyl-tRNA synthetase
LRGLDKLAKAGPEKVLEELQRAEGGAGLSAEQARRVLEFAGQGRGSRDVLARLAVSPVGAHPRAAEGVANLKEILLLLDAAGVPHDRVRIDLGLARGLDYYTGVVFETTVDGWEQYGSISSGGRYDNLASLFSKQRLPGVGASIGLDRLLALMEDAGWLKGAATATPVLVTNFPTVDPAIPVSLAARLRKSGVGAEVFPDAVQIGKQMGYGSTRGHRFAVIVGPDEVAGRVFNLRNLTTRQEQKAIAWDDLETTVTSALDAEGVAS